jgi:hypothetical protein
MLVRKKFLKNQNLEMGDWHWRSIRLYAKQDIRNQGEILKLYSVQFDRRFFCIGSSEAKTRLNIENAVWVTFLAMYRQNRIFFVKLFHVGKYFACTI